jgi:hypothetical protein
MITMIDHCFLAGGWEVLTIENVNLPMQNWKTEDSFGQSTYQRKSKLYKYSARRLMGSRIIESAAYCSQVFLAQLYISSAQNTSVN